jgi:hypothetical protein
MALSANSFSGSTHNAQALKSALHADLSLSWLQRSISASVRFDHLMLTDACARATRVL